jgi:hypothetical protein
MERQQLPAENRIALTLVTTSVISRPRRGARAEVTLEKGELY